VDWGPPLGQDVSVFEADTKRHQWVWKREDGSRFGEGGRPGPRRRLLGYQGQSQPLV